MKLTKILAGSDLSSWANCALQRAAILAAQHAVPLSLIHIVDPASVPEVSWLEHLGETPRRLVDQLSDEAAEALQAKAVELTQQYGATVDALVERGKDFVEIIRRARAETADLTVLGAHGEYLIRDWLLGTTVERVVRKGDRPVLVVKQEPAGPYRRVVVATDFSIHARRALEWALHLAPGAQVDVLHVHDFWYEERLRAAGYSQHHIASLKRDALGLYLQEMDDFLGACGIEPMQIGRTVRMGYPGPAIAQEAADVAADLVAVGTHGRSGLPYVLLGSVGAHVLREAPCDVLVVPPESPHFGVP